MLNETFSVIFKHRLGFTTVKDIGLPLQDLKFFWLRDRQEWANTRVFIGQFGGPLDKNVVFSLFAEGWDKLNPIWPPHQRGPCKVNFCTTDFRPIFPFDFISKEKNLNCPLFLHILSCKQSFVRYHQN